MQIALLPETELLETILNLLQREKQKPKWKHFEKKTSPVT